MKTFFYIICLVVISTNFSFSQEKDGFINKVTQNNMNVPKLSVLLRGCVQSTRHNDDFYISTLNCFKEKIDKYNERSNLNVNYGDNFEKWFLQYQSLFKIKTYSVVAREEFSFLKYAFFNNKGYDLLFGAIMISDKNLNNFQSRTQKSEKGEEENMCNPYIDYNEFEIVEGKKETLLDFYYSDNNDKSTNNYPEYFETLLLKCGCKKGSELNASEKDLLKTKAKPFVNGFAAFIGDNGKMGIINTDYNIILKPTYDSISVFNENNFAKVFNNNKWGLINSNGKLIKPIEYEDIYIPKQPSYKSQNYAYIFFKKQGIYKCYNYNFEKVNNLEFKYVNRHIYYDGKNNPAYYIIKNLDDKYGVLAEDLKEEILPFEFEDMYPTPFLPTNGRYIFSKKNKKWGTFDLKERMIVTPYVIDETYWFYYGKKGNYNIGDREDFWLSGDMTNDYMLYRVGKKIGLINKFSKIIHREAQDIDAFITLRYVGANLKGEVLNMYLYDAVIKEGDYWYIYSASENRYMLSGKKFKRIRTHFYAYELKNDGYYYPSDDDVLNDDKEYIFLLECIDENDNHMFLEQDAFLENKIKIIKNVKD